MADRSKPPTSDSSPDSSPDSAPDPSPSSAAPSPAPASAAPAAPEASSAHQFIPQPNPQPGPPAGSSAGPPVIGIAGGIGSGKSAVARILAEFGCVVSDSDADARAVLDDPEVQKTLADWWGSEVLADDGSVDRGRVAAIVFADPDQRTRLEGLIHPRLHAMREARFAAAPPSTPALVIDAPLLFEAGLADQCTTIIFVDVPRDVRLARVVASRGWDPEELDRREASQLSLDEKRARADHAVSNTGELTALRAHLRALLHDIVSATS
ncbi:MAG: dephospho-CoA kinase [Phycisphaerales bacterium]